jgi:hypothetical protein
VSQPSGETVSLIGQPPLASAAADAEGAAQGDDDMLRRDDSADGVEPEQHQPLLLQQPRREPRQSSAELAGVPSTILPVNASGLLVGMWELAAAKRGINVWQRPAATGATAFGAAGRPVDIGAGSGTGPGAGAGAGLVTGFDNPSARRAASAATVNAPTQSSSGDDATDAIEEW